MFPVGWTRVAGETAATVAEVGSLDNPHIHSQGECSNAADVMNTGGASVVARYIIVKNLLYGKAGIEINWW